MSDGKGDPDAPAIRLRTSSGYCHFNRRVNGGAQGARHELRHVRRGVEVAAVEELRVVLVQDTASGAGSRRVSPVPRAPR